MKTLSLRWASTRMTLAIVCLALFAATAQARDLVLPAGTLLQCTMDEPNFSSATASVGDPFLCYPRTVQQFGQTIFPRGTYLVGHLEADKEPGHFVGKGYLQLTIDRIGLPATDLPLSAKVISVAKYRVDKEGKVIGHGHATRDVVEWCLPPLWPWKVLTLPARGPRPALKGEVRITLRVMDDLIVPQQTAFTVPPSNWHRFNETPSAYAPRGYNQNTLPVGGEQTNNTPHLSMASTSTALAGNTAETWPANVTLFATANGAIIPVNTYWRQQDHLGYVLSDGDQGLLALNRIDWSLTTKLNSQRNVRVTLRNGPPAN